MSKITLFAKRNNNDRMNSIKKNIIKQQIRNEEKNTKIKKNKVKSRDKNVQGAILFKNDTNNIMNQFAKLDIKLIYISKGLSHFSQKLLDKYDLKDVTIDINKYASPCIFFGMYDNIDLDSYISYKGLKYVVWGGSDIDITVNMNLTKANIINTIKNYQGSKSFAISTSIKKRLDYLDIQNVLIDFNLVNKNLYKPLSTSDLHNNNTIYVYNGFRSGNETIYGKQLYDQVEYKVPEFLYLYSANSSISHENMFSNIYSKSFIGLRLTKEDGNANTVQEMEECNIKVVFNNVIGATNTIPFTNSDDISLSIREENMKIFIQHIKDKYKSVLFLCTDYPSYGGAATNTELLLEYFIANNISSYCIFVHDTGKVSDSKNYQITNIKNVQFAYHSINKVRKFDVIITRNYINYELNTELPILFLVPGLFKPNLNKYWYSIKDTEYDKYINNKIIKTARISTSVYVGTLYTKQVLEKYGIQSKILSFNYIPFFNNKLCKKIIPSNYTYTFGIIQSDFMRQIKNADKIIRELLETGEKIILIGKNSTIYSKYKDITTLPLINRKELLSYYPKIKYVINDSFYESCCNVLLESKYNGSTGLMNLPYLFENLDKAFNTKFPINIGNSKNKILLLEDFKYTMDDIININNYSSRYTIIYIRKESFTSNDFNKNSYNIHCKDDSIYTLIKYYFAKKYGNVYIYDQSEKGIYQINGNYSVYNALINKNIIKKFIELNIKNVDRVINSGDSTYKALIKDTKFMNENILQLCFCCDRNYIIGLIVAIQSIVKNTCNYDKLIFNICIPKEDYDFIKGVINFYMLDNINYLFVTFDNDDRINKINLTKDGGHLKSLGNLIRLNIGATFNTSRLLYIDSDLVFNRDIFELSFLKLYNKDSIISGIKSETDFGTIINKSCHSKLHSLGLGGINLETKIINTGIYILNCSLWNKEGIYNKINKLLDIHSSLDGGLFRCFTMSLLNLALWNKTEYFLFHRIVIDLGWKNISKNILDRADILDWSGNKKPWLIDGNYVSYWDKYFLQPQIFTQKKLFVIISHPLHTIGGAQKFIKHFVDILSKNNTKNYFIIFHSSRKVFTSRENVYEYDLSCELIYAMLSKLKSNIYSVIFNNSNWYFNNYNKILEWITVNNNVYVIVHNEFSPVIKFITASGRHINKVICVNNKIKRKIQTSNSVILYPFTFECNLTRKILVSNKNNIDLVFAYVGRYCKFKYISPIIDFFKRNNVRGMIVTNEYPRDHNVDGIRLVINGDMDNIYNEIDYLVITSVTEGLPCIILEGLSYGIPIISVNVGGIGEIIVDNYNGFLIQVPFLSKYDDIIYMENFDSLLEEFNANRSYIDNELDRIYEIIKNMSVMEKKVMRENCINTIRTIYPKNVDTILSI